MRCWRVSIICLLLVVAVMPLQAQGALRYGVPVTGEITDIAPEQRYTFFGKADEVIVLSMTPVDTRGDLDRTMLSLLNNDGQVLVEYDRFGALTMFAALPYDGEYTVVATRPVEDDSVGEYSLLINLINEVKLGDTLSDTVSTGSGSHLYLYRGESDFYLSYTKNSGDFAPEISVNMFDQTANDGQLDTVGALHGKNIRLGSMGVFNGGDVYIISLNKALFDINFGEITASYTLEVLDASKLN